MAVEGVRVLAVLAWILGFISGEAFAYVSELRNLFFYDHRYWILFFGGIVFLSFVAMSRTTSAHYAVTALGFFWGFAHFAQAADKVVGFEATIVGHENLSYFQRQAHISVGDGHVYKLYSRLPTGERGRVACIKKALGQTFCTLRPGVRSDAQSRSVLGNFVGFLNVSFLKRISRFPEGARAWLRLLILGDTSLLSSEEKEAYKHCGLFHLLVISGFHISLVGDLGLRLCIKGLALLYAFRLMSARTFLFMQAAMRILVAIFALVFGLGVGMSPASQRASIAFAIFQIASGLSPQLCRISLLCLVCALQTLVFPIGFFAAGNIMSWFGYILFSSQKEGSAWLCLLKAQWLMFLVTVVLFWQWTPLGLFLNFIFSELFNGIIILGLLCFIFGENMPFLAQLLEHVFMRFSLSLLTLSSAFPLHDYLNRHLPPSSFLTRFSCLFLLVFFLKSFSSLASEAKIKLHALMRIYYGRHLEGPKYSGG